MVWVAVESVERRRRGTYPLWMKTIPISCKREDDRVPGALPPDEENRADPDGEKTEAPPGAPDAPNDN
jgi:hypothetical protein